MDTRFVPKEQEERIYSLWEKSGAFAPESGKPYTVLMPPPNANASLHAGHGMYVVDDIITRWKRLQGYASLWIPGRDHAGFETQYVYEKKLAKEGKSRMDFDRQTLYNNVFQFVNDNSGLIFQQFRRLGFLADWKRSVFTLDPHVLKRVFLTFQQMEKEGLVYRDNYIVNYCTHCGTSLAELEVLHEERIDPLYYMKYGPFTLATVRPETKFGDTAVAVHPKDKRYAQWVGKEVGVEGLLGKFKIKVIADEMVDMKFGTGVVKVTPAHDPNDFETGKRHGLEVKQVIDLNGRLNHYAGPYAGLKVKEARKRIAEDMEKKGLMEKVDTNYLHAVTVCYKCRHDLEPMVMPNWFIKVKDLKQPVIKVVKENKVKFHPAKYKKQILQWLENMHDWPISRQIAWGIRIPVWYSVTENPEMFVTFLNRDKQIVTLKVKDALSQFSFNEIESGLQKISAPKNAAYIVSETKPEGEFLQETDTLDTWFSSGQWPLVTLKDDEYQSRFPTDFMGTLADILNFWVSRMIMFSLYIRKEVPFKNVYLWSMVVDGKGQKMSKSKGNVINPMDLVDKHGADAFRAALLFGVSQGGRVPLSEDKVIAMRNFANKIWNIGRFIDMSKNSKSEIRNSKQEPNSEIIENLKKEFGELKKKTVKNMNSYKFSQAFNDLYEFVWHRYADFYIEALKEDLRNGNIETWNSLKTVLCDSLKLLHPFMPFVTEAVYQELEGTKVMIISSTL
ncbi:MAG: valine--tRNA ligase [Patescibacteria group bacterium]|jgi:valyl-tRNA synthetase